MCTCSGPASKSQNSTNSGGDDTRDLDPTSSSGGTSPSQTDEATTYPLSQGSMDNDLMAFQEHPRSNEPAQPFANMLSSPVEPNTSRMLASTFELPNEAQNNNRQVEDGYYSQYSQTSH